MGILSAILGDPNEKLLKKHYWPVVDEVNGLEEDFARLSDAQLRSLTDRFRQRLAEGETIDDILPEVFAAVREASRRTIGLRHFDVQLVGGMVLHQGAIAEMKTGEGKTLVASLSLYLNALTDRGAHLVTVNDYLAKRDAQWMGPIYLALGLSVGVLQHDAAFLVTPEKISEALGMEHLAPAARRQVYGADITYGTNNEFGFDYLRDNMVVDLSQKVQRELHYAIVDEVDNILIDEARTPLIISGQAGESAQLYNTFARLVPRLEPQEHYAVDEKHRSASLTEEGVAMLEKMLGVANIYAPENYRLTRFMEAALRAHALYQQDRDYVVRDGEVIIVDEFTGRLMPGRRYSEGLHQAIEAKEGVQVRHESVTLATITLQNYFRLYEKLAGMTGTAVTQAEELDKIYKLEVMVVPTHRPMIREDASDLVYRSEKAKFRAVVEEIEELHARGQPALVGTVSIEKSEYLADLLKRTGSCDFADCRQYHHVCPLKNPAVLNAKHHEREAHIVAQAGHVGAVTIATNMAGRGTDIILGGNPEGRDRAEWEAEHNRVVELGGLHMVGTERHEARRIDNQLRGRAGRQGDPGSSRFFVSFEDDIMRRFAPEWLPGFMAKLGMAEDTPLESGMVTRAIEQAQTRVEGYNFDIRKRLVEYDDVVNQHRDTIYAERRKILEGADLRRNILDMLAEEVALLVELHLPPGPEEPADLEGLLGEFQRITAHSLRPEELEGLSRDEVHDLLLRTVEEQYEAREREMGEESMRTLERLLMLRTIDSLWVEHLTAMDEMRQGIGLRAYGGTDPLVVYKREAHDMWAQLLENIRHTLTRTILNATLTRTPVRSPAPTGRSGQGSLPAGAPGGLPATRPTAVHPSGGVVAAKVGRNTPCPCGSGRKYKKCHGAAA